MMVWSINLLVLSVAFLIVGMVKPQWLLFWMEKPTRMPIIFLSIILFMSAAVMFGEANRDKQDENKSAEPEISKKFEDVAPVVATEAKEVLPVPDN